jgi:hypothetical protein
MYDEPALVFSKDEVKTEVSKQFSLFLVITAPRARARARADSPSDTCITVTSASV